MKKNKAFKIIEDIEKKGWQKSLENYLSNEIYGETLKALKSNRYFPIEQKVLCATCNFTGFKTYKDYIKHVNKTHPPQAPKEWICKCRKLKYECKKHE